MSHPDKNLQRQHGQLNEQVKIPLWRAGSMVSSLAGAFGEGLRETRLTALLGYLIALEPEPWLHILGFHGQATDVAVETHQESGRSDIEIRTTSGVGIIEAKIDSTDPLRQALKYNANWRVLLTDHAPLRRKQSHRGIRYIRWADLIPQLRRHAASTNHRLRFVAGDLITYLEEHHMVSRGTPSPEIYAREINNEETLALFLHGRMYGCWHQNGSRLGEAHYFAPHFGRFIANSHPGIHTGISYIAKIDNVRTVVTWQDWVNAVRDVRGKVWYKKHAANMAPLRKQWSWKGQKARDILFLGEPRLAFTPAIRKENIQTGRGFLSKLYLTFDELYQAWGGKEL